MSKDEELYVLQLKAMIACGQSDGLLKKSASDKLAKIEVKPKSS